MFVSSLCMLVTGQCDVIWRYCGTHNCCMFIHAHP